MVMIFIEKMIFGKFSDAFSNSDNVDFNCSGTAEQCLKIKQASIDFLNTYLSILSTFTTVCLIFYVIAAINYIIFFVKDTK